MKFFWWKSDKSESKAKPEAEEAQLAKLLLAPDHTVRQKAYERLGELASNRSLDLLVQGALWDRSKDLKQSVRERLLSGNIPALVAALARCYEERGRACERMDVVGLLSETALPETTALLMRILRDPAFTMVQTCAARALRKLGDPSALSALSEAASGRLTPARSSHSREASGGFGISQSDAQRLEARTRLREESDLKQAAVDAMAAIGGVKKPPEK